MEGTSAVTWTVHTGDALETLRAMKSESVNCCITSPPYWGLRDYDVTGQIGLEGTLDQYLDNLLAVLAEVNRVLRSDGTLWIVIGDAYVARRNGGIGATTLLGGRRNQLMSREATAKCGRGRAATGGLKYKDLIGVPWRLAFALQSAGWWLRSDIIWSKPNPMPQSVQDRPTSSHEYLFLLSKSVRYHYDSHAIKEEATYRGKQGSQPTGSFAGKHGREAFRSVVARRNKRSVWTIHPKPFRGAHFATFPPKLIEPCVLAGCPVEGLVLDPFSGAGTTGVVALQHGRSYVGIELNPEYAEMSRKRIAAADPIGRQERMFA